MSGYTDSERRRRRSRNHASRKEWYRTYRQRIADGLELCRNCASADDLTFDHLVPNCLDGRFRLSNVTILCRACNEQKGYQQWGHLKSLADEEAASSLDPNWSRATAPTVAVIPKPRRNPRPHPEALTYRPFHLAGFGSREGTE